VRSGRGKSLCPGLKSHHWTKAKWEAASLFEVITLHDEPGNYFENTGQLQQVEVTWKLVIEIDILAARFLRLEEYREQTQKLCEKIHENIQPTY